MLAHDIAAAFRQHFGSEPLLVRAPGRINLIGEHTDYNAGYVLPAAIDKEMYFAVALNQENRIRLRAHDFEATFEVAADAVEPSETEWANYLLGVVAQLQKRGVSVPGFDCVFGGTVPAGAGLSSSAALECGMLFALDHLLGTKLEPLQIAKMGQAAEHEYAKVMCGLMDQFASVFGRQGQAVRLDCRSLEYEYFPFDTSACRIVLCNSGVKHSLASSEYNTRRQECEQGVSILRQHYPAIQTLRDVTLEQLAAHQQELGDVVYRRCSYVVEENQRVEETCRVLVAGDLAAVGQQLYASHAGLRDKYEVSCKELDVLVQLAQNTPGVYGARMMGGGFGGCTINLVATDQVPQFVEHMKAKYRQYLGLPLETYEATIVDGVSLFQEA